MVTGEGAVQIAVPCENLSKTTIYIIRNRSSSPQGERKSFLAATPNPPSTPSPLSGSSSLLNLDWFVLSMRFLMGFKNLFFPISSRKRGALENRL